MKSNNKTKTLLQNLKLSLSRKDGYLYHATTRLLRRKPRLALKLFRLYSVYMLTNRNHITTLDIAITNECPYNCPHCYPDKFYAQPTSPLSALEIVDVVRQGADMRAVQFNFQGGEPTLDLDRLEFIVANSDPWSSYISLSSNGFRYKMEDLERIYHMGVDKIGLSLHSGIAEEHDSFVGSKGSYDRVIKCFENSRKVGIEATFVVVVTRENIYSEGVRQVIDMCLKNDIILDVNVAMPVGKWTGQTQYLLRDEDYRYLDNLNRNHPNIRRDLHPHLFRTGCPAAKEFLYINAYGDVLACPFLHFSLGNVRYSRLKDLHRKALNNRFFNYYHPKCLACEDIDFFEKYVSKTFHEDLIPIDWDRVFLND